MTTTMMIMIVQMTMTMKSTTTNVNDNRDTHQMIYTLITPVFDDKDTNKNEKKRY